MFGDKIQEKENLPYRWLTHWKWATMVTKIRPVRVTRGGWCCARLTRRFFKACAITRFRNQFARGQKTIGSHLKGKTSWSIYNCQIVLPIKVGGIMNCWSTETSPECPLQKLQLSLFLFLNITAEILCSDFVNLGKLSKQQTNLFCSKLHFIR